MKKVSAVIVIFLQVAPLLTIATFSKGIDTKEIANIGGRRYYFSEIMVTSPEAITVCQELNMTLAGLETQEEFDAVTDYMRTQGKTDHYYTSGSRLIDTWIWSNTGVPVSYFKWDGNPIVSDNTKQLLICIRNGYMLDTWPYTNLYFICEDPMLSCS